MEETPKRKPGRPKGSTQKRNLKVRQKNKQLLLKSLEEHNGIVQPACKAAGIDRSAFNQFYENDPVFREQVDEIREGAIDKVESQLYKNIQSGKEISTIFFLKTRARNRGYVEQVDSNINIDMVKIRYVLPEGEQLQQIYTQEVKQIETPEIKVIENN